MTRQEPTKPASQPPLYDFVWHGPESEQDNGAWVEVSGGGLPSPIRLRIGKSPGGETLVPTAVVIDHGDQEVTSETLRAIRLREILRSFWDAVNVPDDGPRWRRATPTSEPELVEDDQEFSRWLIRYFIQNAPELDSQPGDLAADQRRFAQAYRRELVRNPRRAMTAAAEELGISRATAHRWATKLREQGVLPSRDA